MEKLICKKCGKIIEGYNKNHVEHLMQQHNLVHERKKKDKNDNKKRL